MIAALAITVMLGLALLALTIWRPAIGLAVMALAAPLTVGLGRGTVIPLLRVNEALVAIVVIGVVLHHLPRRRRLPLTALDAIVGLFAIGLVLIPTLYLLLTRSSADLDQWRAVFGPVQFLVVYLVFARTELSDGAIAACLNLALLASLVIGLVAIVQLTGVFPGLRDFVETYYPPTELRAWEQLHRPPSLLGHFSAVGAFAALNYTLALALAATRHPRFSRIWLSLVLAVNAAAVLASLTVAPILALLPITIAIIWYARRVPRELIVTGVAAIALGVLLLAPFLAGRIAEQQIGFGGGQGMTLPQTLNERIYLWQAFFFPALAPNILVGTGTLVPSQVPEALNKNIDNEYLGEAFRAGVLGVALLILFLVGLAVIGLRGRDSPGSWPQVLGGAVFAYALLIAAIGLTAQYLSYGGVLHQIALVIGLLAASTRKFRQPSRLPSPVAQEDQALFPPPLRGRVRVGGLA